ncbi:MAG: diguanylate cyclase [Pseudomonadota bacterium]
MSANRKADEILNLIKRALHARVCAFVWPGTGQMASLGDNESDRHTLTSAAERLRVGQPALPDDADGWQAFADRQIAHGPVLLVHGVCDIGYDHRRLIRAAFGALHASADAKKCKIARDRLEHLVDHLEMLVDLGIWQIDIASGQVDWSDAAYAIHGVNRDSFVPTITTMLDPYPEEVRGVVRRSVVRAVGGGERFDHVVPLRRADGTLRTVRFAGTYCQEHDGPKVHGIVQDLSSLKDAEMRLWWTANHDALTGLPNRMLFQERLETAISHARQTDRSVGLILVDLDHFKAVNDVYGHEAGDELLRAVAERLSRFMRQGDTLARLGGDEFAIIVKNLEAPEHLERPIERLAMAAEVDFSYRDISIPVKLSMGAAVFPQDAKSQKELYRNADLALFRTKDDADARSTIYRASHGAERAHREDQLRRIRQAIATGAIAPYYQPVFDLTTGAVASVEVLARWRDGNDVVTAHSLAPAFRDPELAPQLGLLMIEQLRKSWCSLSGQLRGTPSLSINVSPQEIKNLAYIEALRAFMEDVNACGCQLVAELSESPSQTLPSQVMPTFDGLVKDGLCFGFDSLSAGFEALVEAPGLKVTQIKAHKATLTQPHLQDRAATIIGGMIETCHQLGVQLIATQIETEDELNRLRALGYRLGQGHFFCQAVHFDELIEQLSSRALTLPSVGIAAQDDNRDFAHH